jgi:hypothetical protein
MYNIISNEINTFVREWVHTKETPDDKAMEVDDCIVPEEDLSQDSNNQKNIYECSVEEGCTAEFIKFGNYLLFIYLFIDPYRHRCRVRNTIQKK